jgi:hypothetical protein
MGSQPLHLCPELDGAGDFGAANGRGRYARL